MPRIILSFIAFLLCFSCKKEDTPPPKQYDETLFIYMIADNNLYNDAIFDCYQIARGLKKGQKVVVYIDAGLGNVKLYELNLSNMSSLQNHVVKVYSHDNSTNPKVMHQTLLGMIQRYPSQYYDLILWSHSSSWFPDYNTRRKSFGSDAGASINIDELAKALPIKFRTILFDSCVMGSMEVISELQSNAEYIVASPTIVPKEGFNCREMIPELLNEKLPIQERLINASKQYITHYRNQVAPAQEPTSISIYKTAYIPDVEKAFQSIQPHRKETISSENVLQLDSQYECYDFHDMLKKNYTSQDYETINRILKKLIIFHDHANWSQYNIDLQNSNGVSCYIPKPNETKYKHYYHALTWSKNSNYDLAIYPDGSFIY